MTRAALLGALAAALLLAGCGGDDEPAPISVGTAMPAASPTATPSPAPTPAAADQALWPPQGSGGTDPLQVARSFVTDYIGVEGAPQLGEFREGEPRAGEVEVFRRAEDGSRLDTVVSTLSLRQLDGERWSVTSAQSGEVELDSPEALALIASPVTVSGRGRGFEGNVVLEVRAQFATGALAQEAVIAGSMEELEPFSAKLAFDAPGAAVGAIVAKTGSGISAADGFAALPVRFQAP